jgi:hypothetical protein
MKRRAILLTLVLILLLVTTAQAMRSTNYALDWLIPLTSGGGGGAASTNYAVHYSVGQTYVGDSHSTNFGVSLGFWQNFIQQLYLRFWLPIIQK